MSVELRNAVEAAAGRPEIGPAVRAVYDAVQIEIDARKPVCDVSGRCCNFEAYGHRLYVTTLELAAFISQLKEPLPLVGGRVPAIAGEERMRTSLPMLPAAPHSVDSRSQPSLATGNRRTATNSCPFQFNKLCGVHAIRPFGCRMFFCDPTATEWQNGAYERFHAEIKALHERLAVPYFYVEWRAALQQLEPVAADSFPAASAHL